LIVKLEQSYCLFIINYRCYFLLARLNHYSALPDFLIEVLLATATTQLPVEPLLAVVEQHLTTMKLLPTDAAWRPHLATTKSLRAAMQGPLANIKSLRAAMQAPLATIKSLRAAMQAPLATI
jgi:hypothetical protein